jgi:hypothetical protein
MATLVEFPSLDALRLALTSGVIPAEVASAPVQAEFPEDGRVRALTAADLGPKFAAGAAALGGTARRAKAPPGERAAYCWAQLLPTTRREPELTEKTPVLLEMPADKLAEVAGEVFRLGNDRQGFRILDDGAGRRALLRVIGPPYYSLLRALDREGDDAPRAYLERGSRVWVEIGQSHPLADRITPPPDKLILIRAPRRWSLIEEGRFRDIYEATEFPVAEAPTSWKPAEPGAKIAVPLRVARGGAGDPAELWVLHEDPAEQIDELVRNADDHLIARLSFAIGESGGRAVGVIRARPSKQPPPVLVLKGLACRPYLRLPNLFLPVDARLHPPLRRDKVAELFAKEPDRVTWLVPGAGGSFTPESLPDRAFLPLAQWVDYVIDRDHEALLAWSESARFEFEGFVCRDGQSPEPEAPRKPTRPRDDKADRAAGEGQRPGASTAAAKRFEKARDEAKAAGPPAPGPAAAGEAAQAIALDAARERIAALEEEFRALEAPLDDPGRLPIWRELAQLHARIGRGDEAALCWANAAWEQDDPEAVPMPPGTAPGASWEKVLEQSHPALGDVRAAALAAIARAVPPERVGPVARFLERHEGMLPIRLAWLAWHSVARLAGDDVLLLARARDRMLERLHLQGLRWDLDLPAFLRFQASGGGEQHQAVRDAIPELHRLARAWVAPKSPNDGPYTPEFVDWAFAFGMARLGLAPEARDLAHRAASAEPPKDLAHQWIRDALGYRVAQALENQPFVTPLPRELEGRLAAMKAENRIDSMVAYMIEKWRQWSEILEPLSRFEATQLAQKEGELIEETKGLFYLADPEALGGRLLALGAKAQEWPEPEARAHALALLLGLAPQVGESVARELIARVPPILAKSKEPRRQSDLLERALFISGLYDLREPLRGFVAKFHDLIGKLPPESVMKMDAALGRGIRTLRRLGLRDEISALLNQVVRSMLPGHEADPIAGLAAGPGKKAIPAEKRSQILRILLHVASGWLDLGRDGPAMAIIDEAERQLFESELATDPKVTTYQTQLAPSYLNALGRAPVAASLPKFARVLGSLPNISDSYSTKRYVVLSKVRVVDAAVLALASEEFTLGRAGRRWLDDDEFLVRRRIHRDVRKALGAAGGS